jgi:hypothetical protein
LDLAPRSLFTAAAPQGTHGSRDETVTQAQRSKATKELSTGNRSIRTFPVWSLTVAQRW